METQSLFDKNKLYMISNGLDSDDLKNLAL